MIKEHAINLDKSEALPTYPANRSCGFSFILGEPQAVTPR